ncbi:MAG: hypothetical protein K2O33_08170 [Muribaculaceae bacterium]|nr:hypothetical protein [Muribaculaceae bacterium]
MKFNKLYMALGVAAIALSSCSDEDDYTPAAAVVTPPAYFNISDTKEVDLEKNSVEFSFPIYRAEAGGAFNPNLAIEIVSGDGVSSATAPFTFLNSDDDPIFAEGATTGAIKYAVDMDQITPRNDYKFLVKADGESTPYFITSTEYVVSYIPWVSMADPTTGALSTLEDYALWLCLQSGPSITLDVVVEKHPEKPLFRLTHPYLNAPGAVNALVQAEFAEYYLDPNEPNYLYLNTENPNAVFFCDSKGDIIKDYEIGVRVIYNETWMGYGNLLLLNMYWYYLNNEWYMVSDTQGISPESGEFNKCIGQFKDGSITFADGGVWFGFTKDKEAVWDGKSWVLKLPGAAQLGWASLGVGTFTDGFIAQFWGEPLQTFQVTIMESETDNNVFRLENPFRFGNGYPLADASTDASGDGPWNIVVDCSDPNFVIIEPQSTGFMVGTEQFIANAAGYYTTTTDPAKHLTKEQVIANGWNDTYDAATRTITINHPMVSGDNGATWASVWEQSGFQPSTIILPGEGAQAAQAKGVSTGKISFAKPHFTSKITRR